MKPKLIIAILVIAAVPVCAQAQNSAYDPSGHHA
jgi:hypothetical protein